MPPFVSPCAPSRASARCGARWLVIAAAWVAVVVSTGCAARPSKPVLRAADYSGVVRVACVGDSITYGAGVEQREQNCWPVVLGKFLGPRFEVRNFGVNGATLLVAGDKPYITLPEFAAVQAWEPQVILVTLGTNDTKPANWQEHGNLFTRDLEAFLRGFQALPSRPRLWICLPPPVYQTRWGINEATLAGGVIPAIREVAARLQLPVIDLHTALSDRPQYFPDGVHPNAAGAGMIAITVATALKGR